RPSQALLASVRPRDVVGRTRRRVAAELVADLEKIYARSKTADKELRELLVATGTTLTDLHGIGPSGAARLLVEVNDVTPFPDQGPLRVLDRHRPHRRLLRRSRAASALARRKPPDQPGAAHHGHRPTTNTNQGPRLLRPQESRRQTSMEAMRCLKRR